VTLNVRNFARYWLPAMLLSSLLGGGAVFAAETVPEPAVRAALVFNFLKFTEWPATANGSPHLQLCIAASDAELITALESLNARQIRGKALLTTTFRQQTDCAVIYVDSHQRWNGIEKPALTHALTIGGYTGFVNDGGMIEIVLQSGGSRFDINLGEAKRAGLRFYPQMLKLARRLLE